MNEQFLSISGLIAALQEFKAERGDLPVYTVCEYTLPLTADALMYQSGNLPGEDATQPYERLVIMA